MGSRNHVNIDRVTTSYECHLVTVNTVEQSVHGSYVDVVIITVKIFLVILVFFVVCSCSPFVVHCLLLLHSI